MWTIAGPQTISPVKMLSLTGHFMLEPVDLFLAYLRKFFFLLFLSESVSLSLVPGKARYLQQDCFAIFFLEIQVLIIKRFRIRFTPNANGRNHDFPTTSRLPSLMCNFRMGEGLFTRFSATCVVD